MAFSASIQMLVRADSAAGLHDAVRQMVRFAGNRPGVLEVFCQPREQDGVLAAAFHAQRLDAVGAHHRASCAEPATRSEPAAGLPEPPPAAETSDAARQSTFDAARRMRPAPQSDATRHSGRFFDTVTQRPVWPAALVPARLYYDAASIGPCGVTLQGARVDDVFEQWHVAMAADGRSHGPDMPLGFFTDDLQLVGMPRVVLDEQPHTEAEHG